MTARNTELRNVTPEDCGQQRPGDGSGDFLAKMAADKSRPLSHHERARMP